jgi:hypothetical protein
MTEPARPRLVRLPLQFQVVVRHEQPLLCPDGVTRTVTVRPQLQFATREIPDDVQITTWRRWIAGFKLPVGGIVAAWRYIDGGAIEAGYSVCRLDEPFSRPQGIWTALDRLDGRDPDCPPLVYKLTSDEGQPVLSGRGCLAFEIYERLFCAGVPDSQRILDEVLAPTFPPPLESLLEVGGEFGKTLTWLLGTPYGRAHRHELDARFRRPGAAFLRLLFDIVTD